MGRNLVNDLLIFDTAFRRIGDDLYGTPTVSAGFNINVNTLFNSCAQVMAVRRSTGVLS
jgi:hypothetical protein